MKQLLLVFIAGSLCALQAFAQQRKMIPVDQLIDTNQTGWHKVERLLASSKNKIEILPAEKERADSVIFLSQISTKTELGGVIHNTGGILIDNGWIRILGSGSKQLNRNLPHWNKGRSMADFGDSSAFTLIADDAVGGFYAINNGGIEKDHINRVYYYGPNSLKWQVTGLSYAEFIIFCISDGLKNFYRDFRWNGWQEEVAKLDGNQVVSCYPLLWTKEGRELKCNRKVVSVQKLWSMYQSGNRASLNKTVGDLSENIDKK
jgi:hypothetical protein